MLKLMGKNIFTILRSKFLFIQTCHTYLFFFYFLRVCFCVCFFVCAFCVFIIIYFFFFSFSGAVFEGLGCVCFFEN